MLRRLDWVAVALLLAILFVFDWAYSLVTSCGPSEQQQAAKCAEKYYGLTQTITYRVLAWLLDLIDRHHGLVAAAATIAIAWFTWTLRNSTERLFLAGEKQIAVARRSADIAEDSLVKLQRAFIFPADIEVAVWGEGAERSFNFRMRWENSGPTPALDFRQHFNWGRFNGPMNPEYQLSDIGIPNPSPNYVAPKGVRRSGSFTLSAQHAAEIMGGQITLYFWGWVTYRDIFQSTPEHITRFCWQAFPTGDDPLADGGFIEWAFHVHNRGNCVDEGCA